MATGAIKSNSKIPKKTTDATLFKDIATLIEQSQKQVAIAANSAVVYLYWQIGKRINTEVLNNKRAEYAQEIVSTQLKTQYGKSFELRNVRRMMQFTDEQICRDSVTTIKLVAYFR